MNLGASDSRGLREKFHRYLSRSHCFLSKGSVAWALFGIWYVLGAGLGFNTRGLWFGLDCRFLEPQSASWMQAPPPEDGASEG